jgi:hypothetical protein
MIFVALVAVFLGWAARERRRRVNELTVELARAQDRVEWAGRMNQRGYVSKAQLASEVKAREGVRLQLRNLWALPDG